MAVRGHRHGVLEIENVRSKALTAGGSGRGHWGLSPCIESQRVEALKRHAFTREELRSGAAGVVWS
ncbi:MAG: hypothetical protein ACE5JI_20920 [Acidobacteriota bacterium]